MQSDYYQREANHSEFREHHRNVDEIVFLIFIEKIEKRYFVDNVLDCLDACVLSLVSSLWCAYNAKSSANCNEVCFWVKCIAISKNNNNSIYQLSLCHSQIAHTTHMIETITEIYLVGSCNVQCNWLLLLVCQWCGYGILY